MQQLNEDFYTFVDVREIASRLNLDESAVEMISVYWKLKRKVLSVSAHCVDVKHAAYTALNMNQSHFTWMYI